MSLSCRAAGKWGRVGIPQSYSLELNQGPFNGGSTVGPIAFIVFILTRGRRSIKIGALRETNVNEEAEMDPECFDTSYWLETGLHEIDL